MGPFSDLLRRERHLGDARAALLERREGEGNHPAVLAQDLAHRIGKTPRSLPVQNGDASETVEHRGIEKALER